MPITIHNSQRHLKVNQSRIKTVLARILKEEGHASSEVSLVLVDNRRIKSVNRKYLKKNRITDVISFPLGDRQDPAGDNLLGEIIVSVEKARQEARRRKIPAQKEVLLYCVHGLLHLLGYDDMTPRKRRRMERRQGEMINRKGRKVRKVLEPVGAKRLTGS